MMVLANGAQEERLKRERQRKIGKDRDRQRMGGGTWLHPVKQDVYKMRVSEQARYQERERD